MCVCESCAFEVATLLLPFLVILTLLLSLGFPDLKRSDGTGRLAKHSVAGSALPWRNLHRDLIFLSHIPQTVFVLTWSSVRAVSWEKLL